MTKCFASSSEIGRVTTRCDINQAIALLNGVEDTIDEGVFNEVSKLCPSGGLVVHHNGNGTVQVMAEDVHSVVFAATNRGKTRRVVFPLAYSDILSGTSLVVNDMKGEIYAGVKDLLALMGYTVYVLDLRQPAKSPHRYNPITIAWDEWNNGNKDAAFTYLRSFGLSLFCQLAAATNDMFWTNTATDYFVGLSMGMLEAGVSREAFTLESIMAMDRNGNKGPGPRSLNEFFDAYKNTVAYQSVSGTLDAPNDTRASILSVFRQPLSLYTGQLGLMDVLARSDFGIKDIAQKRTAVFLISPDETHSLGPVVVGILNQIMSALISYAQVEHGGRLPCRVDFILDEFGNLPAPIPEFDAIISAARSRNIRLHVVLQSIAQLNNVYGEHQKNVILDNITEWVYLGTRGLDFLKHISELMGTTVTESGKSEPVMDISKLQHIEKRAGESEAVILIGCLKPFVAALKDYSCFETPRSMLRFEAGKEVIMREVFDIKQSIDEMRKKRIAAMIEAHDLDKLEDDMSNAAASNKDWTLEETEDFFREAISKRMDEVQSGREETEQSDPES